MSKAAIVILTGAVAAFVAELLSAPWTSSLSQYSGGIAAPAAMGAAPPCAGDGQAPPPVTGSRHAA